MEKPKSWVYFIQAGEAGPIKIGFTAGNPGSRMASLQTGNPERLRLLACVQGDQAAEQAAHAAFAAERLQGEWFRPTPELLAFIRGVTFASKSTTFDVPQDADAEAEAMAEYAWLWHMTDAAGALRIAAECGGRVTATEVERMRANLGAALCAASGSDAAQRFGVRRVLDALERLNAELAKHPPPLEEPAAGFLAREHAVAFTSFARISAAVSEANDLAKELRGREKLDFHELARLAAALESLDVPLDEGTRLFGEAEIAGAAGRLKEIESIHGHALASARVIEEAQEGAHEWAMDDDLGPLADPVDAEGWN